MYVTDPWSDNVRIWAKQIAGLLHLLATSKQLKWAHLG